MRKYFVDFVVFVTGLLSALYILNLGMGAFEILPDALPGVGNLDEATATTLFLACLSYFGIAGDRIVSIMRLLAGKPPLVLTEAKKKDKSGKTVNVEAEVMPPAEKGV